MVDHEERFIDVCFAPSVVEGMNADNIKINGVWPIFTSMESSSQTTTANQTSPLSWIIESLNGVERTNFFDQRMMEYSKGATRGNWEGLVGVQATSDQIDLPSSTGTPVKRGFSCTRGLCFKTVLMYRNP